MLSASQHSTVLLISACTPTGIAVLASLRSIRTLLYLSCLLASTGATLLTASKHSGPALLISVLSSQVLHADLASLGSIKTLPYLAMFASTNFGGYAGDFLIRRRRMPVAQARKVVNTIGMSNINAFIPQPLTCAYT